MENGEFFFIIIFPRFRSSLFCRFSLRKNFHQHSLTSKRFEALKLCVREAAACKLGKKMKNGKTYCSRPRRSSISKLSTHNWKLIRVSTIQRFSCRTYFSHELFINFSYINFLQLFHSLALPSPTLFLTDNLLRRRSCEFFSNQFSSRLFFILLNFLFSLHHSLCVGCCYFHPHQSSS